MIQNLVAEFRETIAAAARQLRQISEDDSSKPLDQGKWSSKQVIGHLIDSAANNHARFVRAQLNPDLVFSGYEQNEWVAIQRYNEEPWEQLVSLWQAYNLHLAHVISVADEGVREQQRRHHNLDKIAFRSVAAAQPATLDFLMRDYVVHLRHHLAQIFRAEDASNSE